MVVFRILSKFNFFITISSWAGHHMDKDKGPSLKTGEPWATTRVHNPKDETHKKKKKKKIVDYLDQSNICIRVRLKMIFHGGDTDLRSTQKHIRLKTVNTKPKPEPKNPVLYTLNPTIIKLQPPKP